MLEKNRLTTKAFWTAPVPGFTFERHQGHAIEKLIKKYIPQSKEGDCLEIGSFPGPFLAAFGDLGYTLHGVDFHPRNEKDLPAWLRTQGFKTGQFLAEDFFNYQPSRRFEVVASFGFIEHFEDFEDLICRHISLVNENGFLVITTPNFRGSIQHWLHRTFDKRNLALHNVQSMQPDVWAHLLEKNGFEIVFKGYFGGFIFWRDKDTFGFIKQKMHWIIARLITRINKIIWFESKHFSGYCGIVARRRKDL